jgi:hypothetical protein
MKCGNLYLNSIETSSGLIHEYTTSMQTRHAHVPFAKFQGNKTRRTKLFHIYFSNANTRQICAQFLTRGTCRNWVWTMTKKIEAFIFWVLIQTLVKMKTYFWHVYQNNSCFFFGEAS